MNHSHGQPQLRVAFSDLPDLASERLGGKVLFASDEFFAGKENLLKQEPAIFIDGKFTDNGKWMDGWESRRKRSAGFDYALIQLGLPGEIHGVNIDTSFFTGNYPEYVSVEAVELPADTGLEPLIKARWTEILSKSSLSGHSFNYFPITKMNRWTHLKLNIYPDGGVARFRAHGIVRPLAESLRGEIDLVSLASGAKVIVANDSYFGPKDNLIYPHRAANMGEGWETRRKRGPGHDWIIVKLAGRAKLNKIEIDTNHFKGNFPDRCSVEGINLKEDLLPCDFRDRKDLVWTKILPEAKLEPHTIQSFENELINENQEYTHIRLSIFPDGGISRLRIWGKLV